MVKELNIRTKNYFSVSQYNCIDLAFSNALTVFSESFYDIYYTYLGIEMNWASEMTSEKILDKLGIVSQSISCKNIDEFEKIVSDSINENNPLVLIPMSNTMFYSYFYRYNDYKGRHGLIIYGYDDEKRIFLIKENIHITEFNDIRMKGTPFYTFAFKYELFL